MFCYPIELEVHWFVLFADILKKKKKATFNDYELNVQYAFLALQVQWKQIFNYIFNCGN